jgi:hypothetical protein
LEDTEQDYRPKYHEEEDSVEEKHLKILLVIDYSEWDPVVADNSIVD